MRPPSTAAPRLVAHADFTDSHSRLHQCCCHCTSAHPYDYGDQPTPPPIPVPSLLLAAPPAPPAPGPPPATVAHVNCGGDGATAAAAAATASTTCLVASDGPPRDIRGALESIERALTSADPGQLVDCTRRIRELLSFERDGSFHDALHRSVVPHLLRFLQTVEKPELQVEALWALTNVAAGPAEHIHTLLKLGAVPVLVRLLDSPSDEVLEQAAWVLGNIACDSVSARDTVLGAGALPKVLACLQRTTRVSLLRIATWALSNLCDGQPRTHFAVSDVLPTLGALLASPDTEVLSHVCWALSHVCDGPTPHIQQVVQASLVSHLVALLSHESWRVVKPALRAIGNIVCAEDEQDYTQHVTDCGAVMRLRALIEYDNKEIQKEACWTLSNIAAGTTDQIQEVIDSGAVPPLVRLARAPLTDLDVRNEACWVLLNATSCGSDAQVRHTRALGWRRPHISVARDAKSRPLSARHLRALGLMLLLALSRGACSAGGVLGSAGLRAGVGGPAVGCQHGDDGAGRTGESATGGGGCDAAPWQRQPARSARGCVQAAPAGGPQEHCHREACSAPVFVPLCDVRAVQDLVLQAIHADALLSRVQVPRVLLLQLLHLPPVLPD